MGSFEWYAAESPMTAKKWLRKALQKLGLQLRSWTSTPPRSLRLRETLALSEKRLVAVVEFEEQRFLLGASGNSIAMLAKLPDLRHASDLPRKRPRAS